MKPWMKTLLVELGRGAVSALGSALGNALATWAHERLTPPEVHPTHNPAQASRPRTANRPGSKSKKRKSR